MIVRIGGEGQYDLPDDAMAELNRLDDALSAAVEASDEGAFRPALAALLAAVRASGQPLPDDALTPSDLVLPPEDESLDEVRSLLAEDGLIPGRPA